MSRDFSAPIRTPVGAFLRWVSPAEAMTQTEPVKANPSSCPSRFPLREALPAGLAWAGTLPAYLTCSAPFRSAV